MLPYGDIRSPARHGSRRRRHRDDGHADDVRSPAGGRWAPPALVVVTAADLGVWGIGSIHREPARTIEALTEGGAAAPEPQRTRTGWWIARAVPLESAGDARIPAHVRLRRYSFLRRHIHSTATPRDGFPGHDGSSRRTAAANRWRAEWRACGSSTSRATTRREARGSSSIVRDVSSPMSTRRADAFSRSPSGSTTAGPRPVTAALYRRCVWKETFSVASWGGVHEVTFRFMPRSFVYGSIVSAFGALLLAARRSDARR